MSNIALHRYTFFAFLMIMPFYVSAAPAPTAINIDGINGTSGPNTVTILDVNQTGSIFVQEDAGKIYLTELTNTTANRRELFTTSSSFISPSTNIHLSDNGAVVFFVSNGTSGLETGATLATLSTAGLVSNTSSEAVYMLPTGSAGGATKISNTAGLPSPDGSAYFLIDSGTIYRITLSAGANFGTVTNISSQFTAGALATLPANPAILAISRDNSTIIIQGGSASPAPKPFSSDIFSLNLTNSTITAHGNIGSTITQGSGLVGAWPNLDGGQLLHYSESNLNLLNLGTNNDQVLDSTNIRIDANNIGNRRVTTNISVSNNLIIIKAASGAGSRMKFLDLAGNETDNALIDISGVFDLGNIILSHDGSRVFLLRRPSVATNDQHIFIILLTQSSGGGSTGGALGGSNTSGTTPSTAADPIPNAVAVNEGTPSQAAGLNFLYLISILLFQLMKHYSLKKRAHRPK